jgi:hypothetical protein
MYENKKIGKNTYHLGSAVRRVGYTNGCHQTATILREILYSTVVAKTSSPSLPSMGYVTSKSVDDDAPDARREKQYLSHVHFFQEARGEKMSCVDVEELGGVFPVQLGGY